MPTSEQIGKAYLAFQAYNHKAKLNRLKDFDLPRWIKVVQALSTKGHRPSRKTWSPAQHKKYEATIARRNGHA
jgi:hypothetical protein